MKTYKVSRDVRYFVRKELTRCHFDCQMAEGNCTLLCKTNAPSDAFHQVVKRARCAQKTQETGILFLTSDELNNPLMRKELFQSRKAVGCCILDDYDGTRTFEGCA